jgi:MoaA/NifB/PqqE/SkfB family radical SAM enzyme
VYPKDIIDNIQKFKEVDIAISIDDIGSRFELTRGGVWKEVEANILRFKELESENFKVYIFPTVNIQNVLYLDELLDWADKNQLVYKFNFLEFPKYYNINSMTDQARELVINKYRDSSNLQLQALANRVKNSAGSDGKMFLKNVKWLDYIRNQDFSTTHNEIAQAMGYNLLSL